MVKTGTEITDVVEEQQRPTLVIGKSIDALIKAKSTTRAEIGRHLYKAMGYNVPSSAWQYITALCNHGALYGGFNEYKKPHGCMPVTSRVRKCGLERLAKLLQYLKVSDDDPLIAMIKEYDADFCYPLHKRRVKSVYEY